MATRYEREGIASRPVSNFDSQWEGQARPSGRAASECGASSSCAANFPILTPHEIATLMLIAHTPGQVGTEWPDLLSLVSGKLVEVDKCRRCRGTPLVTPLGESLVVRLRGEPRRTSNDASLCANFNGDQN